MAHLLHGWHAYKEGPRWVFFREGPGGTERFAYRPRILAAMECITGGHSLATVSFPIDADGQWYPIALVLARLAAALTGDEEMLAWAHEQAGCVLHHEQLQPHVPPEYLYLQGDLRHLVPAGPPFKAAPVLGQARGPTMKEPPTKTPPAARQTAAPQQTAAQEAAAAAAASRRASERRAEEETAAVS